MTDTERKALALVNEAFREPYYKDWSQVPQGYLSDALIRAIEQHEAFRQEVSDAVELLVNSTYMPAPSEHKLRRFIIAKPDPLVEAMAEAFPNYNLGDNLTHLTNHSKWLRAAIEKRGGKIVWGEG